MIESPFRYEEWLTPSEFQKLGEIFLRWSHIEHIIGTCLRVVLRLTEEEAIAMIFPLPLQRRIEKIGELAESSPLNAEAAAAYHELAYVIKCINYVRNSVVHSILVDDPEKGHLFHLRSKKRSIAKAHVFATEELTNYAAHTVLSLRCALGGGRHPRRAPSIAR